VVKACTTIWPQHLGTHGQRPAALAAARSPSPGTTPPPRPWWQISLDQVGFDVVDARRLADGWGFQRGTPAYNARLDAEQLHHALADAEQLRRVLADADARPATQA
jgi:hypothetical protein